MAVGVVGDRQADLLEIIGACDTRRACSRAAWTAGNKSATRIAMIAITTKSSINVNPGGRASCDPASEPRVETSLFSRTVG